MRRILYAFLITFAMANTTLQADYDQIDYTNNLLPTGNAEKPGIFQGGSGMFAIETNSDVIAGANFNNKTHKHQKLSFCGFDVDASMVVFYEEEYHEAVNIELGYNRTNIHWKDNNHFSQSIFNTATLSVNAQSARMCDWLWKGKLSLNVDTDHFDVHQYSTWDCFIWGRYTYNDNFGLHVGIIALTGMKVDHVYPIIGFDWMINHKWKFNAVFPVDISVVYVIDEYWSLDIAGRAIETRNRLGKHENISKGIVQYMNKGIEFGVNYDVGDSIKANIHVGEMIGGRLKISNHQNRNSHRLPFGASPYLGAEVQVRY